MFLYEINGFTYFYVAYFLFLDDVLSAEHNFTQQMMTVWPDAVIVGIFFEHFVRKLYFFSIILDLIDQPDAMTPGMVVFGFDF